MGGLVGLSSMNSRQANWSVLAALGAALVIVIGIKYDWYVASKSAVALGMFLLQVAVIFWGWIAIAGGNRPRAWRLVVGGALVLSYCVVLAYIGAHRELLIHVVLSFAVAMALVIITRRAVK